VLLELLEKLPVDLRDSGFLDYGCGKGRALFCAEYSGFNELIGVELDDELIKDAEQNLSTYSQKRTESHFTFVHQDAVDFKIPGNCRVFYFFNPFSDKVMEKVAENILNYRKTIDKTIYIVYVNPKYDSLWIAKGFKKFYTQKNFRYTEAIIYAY
jgi:predicted RNA methylase